MRLSFNNDQSGNYDDSGLATSADCHSIVFDEPPTPPVLPNKAPRATSRSSNTSTSTIKQHYYTEGGWGWIVVCVAIAVHVLTHGLHMSGNFLG